MTVETELDKEEYPYLFVVVTDYAENEATYKLNLNPEEFEDAEALEVFAPDVTIIGNGTAQLEVEIWPFSVENEEGFSITFESDDETVATVDEDGLVTSVADDDAECGIIITVSHNEDTASYTANVKVKFIDKVLDGVVWDEEGRVWMSEFNLGSLPEYTKLTESPLSTRLTSLAYDQYGNLCGVDLDTDSNTLAGTFYSVDPDTFETTEIGPCTAGYLDLCAAPSLGDDYMLAIYSYYVLVIDKTTGENVAYFDFGAKTYGDWFVGIAFDETIMTDYGPADYVVLVDESGWLYSVGFLLYNDSFANFTPQNISNAIADSVDVPFYQSLYYDGEDLYWSRYNKTENDVDIILIDDLWGEEPAVYDVGSFADNVWPVGGLIELGIIPGAEIPSGAVRPDAVIDGMAMTGTPEAVVRGANNSAKVPGGSLNGIKEILDKNDLTFVDELAENETAVVLTADMVMTNGVATITFDPEKVVSVSTTSSGDGVSSAYIDMENGEITYAFATLTAIPANGPIAEIVFEMKEGECAAAVTAGFTEINENHIAEPEQEEITICGHEYIQPKWTWTEGDDGYTATALFVCENCSEELTVDADIEGLEADGKIIFTATVVVGGVTYTNNYIVDVAYKFVTPEVSWFSGNVTFIVKRNFDDASTFSRFVGVLVDGEEIENTNYVATAGSVNILLKAEYLNTLEKGVHELTVKMADGTATQKLYIKTAISPATGDQSNMTLWIVVAAVAVVALVGTVVILKKKSAAK